MNKIIIHVFALLFLSSSMYASVDEAAAKRILSKRKNNSQHSSLKRTKTYQILHTIDNDSSSEENGLITFKEYLDRLVYADFCEALRTADTKKITALIEQGVDVDKKYEDVIPLHLAVNRGDLDLVQLLLAADANPSIQNSDGHSPLHIATAQESAKIVRVLLEHEADANIQDNEGKTPLHIAVEDDFHEIAELLIIGNSKTDIENNEGKTPLDLVQSKEMRDILA